MKNFICSYFFILIWVSPVFSQSQRNLPDSLKNKSLKELLSIAIKYEDSSLLNKSIFLAKKENNYQILADAYYTKAKNSTNQNRLHYADSIIALKKKIENFEYPSKAYYIKGYHLFQHLDYSQATDNFTEAYQSALSFENSDIIYRSSFALGLIKEELGSFRDANKIYKQNLDYIENSKGSRISNKDHLRTVYALANSYNLLKKYDSSFHYSEKGIHKAIATNEIAEYYNFILAYGLTLYFDGQYNRSLDSLRKAKFFYLQQDATNLALTNLYLAKNHLKLGENLKAETLLKAIDTIYQNSKDLRIRIAETYNLLIDHYKKTNDLESQLIYTNKLLNFNLLFYRNRTSLGKKLNDNYEIPKLEIEKIKILEKLEHKESTSAVLTYSLFFSLLIGLLFFISQSKKKKRYKNRLDKLLNDNEKRFKKTTPNNKQNLDLPTEVISSLDKELKKFEKSKKFIQSDLSLNQLAKQLNTNSKYLSKYINTTKETSFINYINTLRIEYCIDQLKSNVVYRKYTIRAIANEFGFNTAESFSKTFMKITGIKPSYFIKNLPDIENDQ